MKKNNRLLDRAVNPRPFMAAIHCWKYSALATAAAVLVGLYTPDAAALALGPITVQSALGEPLRAEIDLPQITAAEAESLEASTASADAFRAQGLEYTAIANQVQMKLHRRPDGRSVLRLSGRSPVNDPFVDLVVNARWSAGQITRSYTMLFDPPSLRRTPATVTASAQTTAPTSSPAPALRPAPAVAPAPAPVATPSISAETRAAARAQANAETPRPTPAPRQEAPTPKPTPVQRPPAASASNPPEDSVTVKRGETAGRIASAHRPGSVSLDQMLVALLRSNPDAFIQGNINRIKAGAVLQVPSTNEALATSTGEARKIIALQSRDFNAFRRKLAGAAPLTQQAAAERSAQGTVQTRTDDKRTAAATPDKLTLSKGALKGQKSTEEQLAQRKQASDAAARAQEIAKNIADLSQLSTASAAAAAGAAATGTGAAAQAPGITVPAAPPVSVTPPAPAPAATVVAEADKPATPASAESENAADTPPSNLHEGAEADAAAQPAAEAPAVVAIAPPPAKPAPTPAAEPQPEPSFLSDLMEDPALPLAGLGLLALLLGYGGYRAVQQRRNKAPVDSSFMDSRANPDSFFGASGGQRVDTAGNDTTTGGSSLAFTSSQLDAGGDVDPVAEADVYLAYGRDLQAEEILKEALQHNPERLSVYVKLAEIYAKRQDRKALEATAQDLQQRTQGTGPDWARVSDLGRELDPANPLYQAGDPAFAAGTDNADNADNADSTSAGMAAAQAQDAATDIGLASALAVQAAMDDDEDMGLDLDLETLNEELRPIPPAEPTSFADAAKAAAAVAPSEAADADSDMDLPPLDFGSAPSEPSWNTPPPPTAPVRPAPPAPMPEPELDGLADLEFSMDMPELDLPEASPPAAPVSLPPEEAFTLPESGMMEFNLDDLALNLDMPDSAASADELDANAVPPPPQLSDDPLATKLALAQEFNTIGDSDGARTLIEEVIAESSGDLKAKAQRLLSELD